MSVENIHLVEQEENIDSLILDDDSYDCPQSSFHIESDIYSQYDDNPYIQSLLHTADLKILQPRMVSRMYSSRKELGLFSLFFSPTLIEGIRSWTQQRMLEQGFGNLSSELFNSYIGIEIAMSLMHCNDPYDYWSEKRFLGSVDIHQIMSRNTFTHIQSSIKFYPIYDHELAGKDPL